MKKIISMMFLGLFIIQVNGQVILIRETFQDWKAEPGTPAAEAGKANTGVAYEITKLLYDGRTQGKFTSNSIIVAPSQPIGTPGSAEGNGNPSRGRISIRGTSTYLQLPELPSIGKVNIKANAGTDLREFKLQVLKNGSWEDIPGTVTACSKAVTRIFTFNLSYSSPTTLRIVPTSNGAVFIYDLEVFSK